MNDHERDALATVTGFMLFVAVLIGGRIITRSHPIHRLMAEYRKPDGMSMAEWQRECEARWSHDIHGGPPPGPQPRCPRGIAPWSNPVGATP